MARDIVHPGATRRSRTARRGSCSTCRGCRRSGGSTGSRCAKASKPPTPGTSTTTPFARDMKSLWLLEEDDLCLTGANVQHSLPRKTRRLSRAAGERTLVDPPWRRRSPASAESPSRRSPGPSSAARNPPLQHPSISAIPTSQQPFRTLRTF